MEFWRYISLYEIFNPSKVFWSLFSLLILMLHQLLIGVRRKYTYVSESGIAEIGFSIRYIKDKTLDTLLPKVRKRVYCYTIWLQLMVFVDPACRCFVLVRNFSKQTHAQSWPNTERPKCFESWAAHFGCEKFNSWSHIVKQYTRFRTSAYLLLLP